MPQPVSKVTQHRADIERLHAEGKSLTWVCKELGIAKSTTSRKSREWGLTWDRANTVTATTAKVRDAAARRAELQLLLLDDVEQLRKELFEQHIVFNFGGMENSYAEHTLKKPPPADQLKIMQAVGAGIDRHIKLAQHDAGTGTGAIVGLLQQTAAALGINDTPDPQP